MKAGELVSELTIFETGPETLFEVGQVEQRADGVRGSMPTGTPYFGPDGRASVGALGVLVDNALGYVIIDNLVGGVWQVSTEIWLDMLAPLPTDGARLHIDTHCVQADAVAGFSEGRIVDLSGRLLAVCRERGRGISEDPDGLRPTPFELADDATDVAELLGLVPTGPDGLTMTVAPRLENPRGMLHGGISLCASEIVATRSRYRSNPTLATSSVHIVHTRPIPAGATVDFRATTRHAGRSLWVTDVTGWVDGKAACITRVSAQAR